jgi:hypothetical protein
MKIADFTDLQWVAFDSGLDDGQGRSTMQAGIRRWLIEHPGAPDAIPAYCRGYAWGESYSLARHEWDAGIDIWDGED